MFLLHSRNPWHYSQGSNPMMDFCLWVLQVDGLRVPPFDQHPDGSGSLRALGLTADDWQTWFWRALDPVQREQDVEQFRQLCMVEYLKIANIPDLEEFKRRYQAERLKVSTDPPLPPVPEFHYYHASWHGCNTIKNKLIELEDQYRQVETQGQNWRSDVERALSREELKAATRLYDELKPYHNRVPPLNIYLAIYEHPLDYLVPPTSILITTQEGQPGFQEFRERVLAAVAELAAQPKQRRQSEYSWEKGNLGQSFAYRRQERNPVQLRLLKPGIPRLEDPLRQMVLEGLGDEHSWFYVDFATVQFLREKQKPGSRLYEVTFQDTDGQQYRTIAILRQNDDGSWRLIGGGTTGPEIPNQESQFSAPVHDHPLISLETNRQGDGFSDKQYLDVAHGKVIDNGFHVERVRLVNDAGQVLEDTVEDGYVFFVCRPEDQVQVPMQAELYDRQGKLVWREKIPSEGLPPWLKVKLQH